MTPTITIFVRHSADCKYRGDERERRCKCRKFLRWSHNGKQCKRSTKTRTWAAAEEEKRRLEDQFAGRTPVLAGLDLAAKEEVRFLDARVKEWNTFREKNKLNTDKSRVVLAKLVEWCNARGLFSLAEVTPAAVIQFRQSLPYRTGDSSSLKIHWSMVQGFFRWCVAMDYLSKSPVPDPRTNPAMRIKFKKKEIVPATKAEVARVIACAAGHTKLLAMLMEETGMALVDAVKFNAADLEDETLLRGNRTKTHERFRVRLSDSLVEKLKGITFADDQSTYRGRLRKCFKKVNVMMTPHGFRHYRISAWLAQGISVEDVSKMVGTSPKEIRKTYEHSIKESEDRLDDVQKRAWLDAGKDANGNGAVQ